MCVFFVRGALLIFSFTVYKHLTIAVCILQVLFTLKRELPPFKQFADLNEQISPPVNHHPKGSVGALYDRIFVNTQDTPALAIVRYQHCLIER